MTKLSDSKDCSESPIKFFVWLSFPLRGRFSQVYMYNCTFMACFLSNFSGLQEAALGTRLESKAVIWKVWTTFLKRVTGRISIISKWLHRSKQKLYLDFLHRKTTKHCETIRTHKKIMFWFLGPSKKYICLVTLSL